MGDLGVQVRQQQQRRERLAADGAAEVEAQLGCLVHWTHHSSNGGGSSWQWLTM